MEKRIIVTGGAGFIGSHLVDRLIADGYRVTVIDDLSGGVASHVHKKATLYEEDCRNEKKIDAIFEKERPEIVYHLAANAAEGKSIYSPIDITSRNYDAFIKTLVPFIKYGGKRFVFTSSIAVYGEGQTPFRETDAPEPEDLYGISKLAIEQTLKVMSKVHDFEYVIARPHNVYGPRQNMSDPYRNVVTIWMNNILRKQPITIYGDGSMKRCFSYIDDVIEPLYKCGFEDVAGMTFNIGSDTSSTLTDLSEAIGTKDVVYLPKREQEVQDAIADHTLCKKYLGYHETPLKEGIEKTWEWARGQGPQDPLYTQMELESYKVPQNWKHEKKD